MSAQPCRRRCHPAPTGSASAKGGGWGNIALLGAGAALVGAIGGIAIGYATFHRPASESRRATGEGERPGRGRCHGLSNAQRARWPGSSASPMPRDRHLRQARRRDTRPAANRCEWQSGPDERSADASANARAASARHGGCRAALADHGVRQFGDCLWRGPLGAGQPGTQQQGQSAVARRISAPAASGRPAPIRTASWRQAKAPAISATSSGTPPSRLFGPASSLIAVSS
jgi:type IV secretion system protein VirB10